MHTPTIRRAGFLAASALGLALFGALTTNSAGASLPGFCNGLAVTDFSDPLTNTFLGGGAGEVIEGTEDSDTINSGGGNDTICALDGNDEVDAGTGVDWVSGGDDNDMLDGFTENDTLLGDADEDIAQRRRRQRHAARRRPKRRPQRRRRRRRPALRPRHQRRRQRRQPYQRRRLPRPPGERRVRGGQQHEPVVARSTTVGGTAPVPPTVASELQGEQSPSPRIRCETLSRSRCVVSLRRPVQRGRGLDSRDSQGLVTGHNHQRDAHAHERPQTVRAMNARIASDAISHGRRGDKRYYHAPGLRFVLRVP